MKMDTRVFQDLDALSRGVLDELMLILQDSVAKRGLLSVALSGGRTPARMYSLWAQTEKYKSATPWERVHFFWGDERYVPADDPLSNYRMTRETLIDKVPIPSSNVHPFHTELPQPQEVAAAYESEMKSFFGSGPPAFDLQLLGLGGEGHTASLFPDSPALEEKRRWVAAVEVPATPPRRLTMTLPVLNSARNTFFLVAGADKREILAALRNEPESGVSQYPAARVRPTTHPVWFLDQAAAG
jgi:6-phosphogluconolactonase